MILIDEILKVEGCLKKPEKFICKQYKKVRINSLEVKKGDIFFAIKGETNDGHKYIEDVVKRKAGLIFVNKNWYIQTRINIKIMFFMWSTTLQMLWES